MGVNHILGPSPGRRGLGSPHCTLWCHRGSRDRRGWRHPWRKCALLLLSPWSTPSYSQGPSSTCRTTWRCLIPHRRQPCPTPDNTLSHQQPQDSHIALVGVDTVEQGLRCHPLHWQATLWEQTPCSAPTGGPCPLLPLSQAPPTHIAGFLVVVNVMDVSGQAKVSDLHHALCCDQHVASSQVTVDALPGGP